MAYRNAALIGLLFFGCPIVPFAQQNYSLPDARARAHLVYHPASKSMLLFDGYLNHPDTPQNNVWRWDGKKWEEIVAYGPGSRILNAAALNNKTGNIELFGGWGKNATEDKKSDWWVFDGVRWHRQDADTIGTRDHHKMVYMDHVDAFLVYGGFDFNFKNDTTTWLFSNGHFKCVAGKSPGPRGNFAMTYDPIRKKAILFSGHFLDKDKPADLWEFDGHKWEQKEVTDVGIISTYAMVFHDKLKMSVVQNEKGETWGWDGKSMIRIAVGGPTAFGVSMGYDPIRKIIVAYGGYGTQRTAVSSLWELHNTQWKMIVENGTWKQTGPGKYERLDTSVSDKIPEARWAHQMLFDDSRNAVLLFGGSHGNKILGDLWAWNGSAWKELAMDGPPPINKGIFVYDEERKVSVLFGGANSGDQNTADTWEWDGTAWKQIKAAGPPARVHGQGVFDSKNKVVLIFGGFGSSGALSDTWSFDGKHWKQLNAEGPADRMPQALLFDDARKVVTMITLTLNRDKITGRPKTEMWEWNGSDWKQLSILSPQIEGLQSFAVFKNKSFMLYDGTNGTTSQYYAGKWKKVAGDSGPGVRAGHVMVYDKKRGKLVLFGGGIADTDRRLHDTWEWNGTTWEKVK